MGGSSEPLHNVAMNLNHFEYVFKTWVLTTFFMKSVKKYQKVLGLEAPFCIFCITDISATN